MEWRAEAILLSLRPHGEGSAILTLFTKEHGRYSGLMRGARSQKNRAALQAGNLVHAVWRARLAEHLGSFAIEPAKARAALILSDPLRLAGLNAAIALTETAMAERDPHPALYDALNALIDLIAEGPADWPKGYLAFEKALLAEMGLEPDWSACALCGASENLTHISPNTARAVCEDHAKPYEGRLYDFPKSDPQAFEITGKFLEKVIYSPHGSDVPEARARLIDRLK